MPNVMQCEPCNASVSHASISNADVGYARVRNASSNNDATTPQWHQKLIGPDNDLLTSPKEVAHTRVVS